MKKQSAMERAALALLAANCYGMGRSDDHFAFAGRHEAGCMQLHTGGLAELHPRGPLVFARRAGTLTSSGTAEARQAYRLTESGKRYAEQLKEKGPIP